MAVQTTTNPQKLCDSISVTHRFKRLILWLCVLIAETVDVRFKAFWALTSIGGNLPRLQVVNHVLLQTNKTGVWFQNIVNSSSSCFHFSLMTNFLVVMVGVVLLKKLFPSKFLLKCSHLALIRNTTRLLLSTFCASNTSGKTVAVAWWLLWLVCWRFWIQTDTVQSTDRDHNWLESSYRMAFFSDQYCSVKALAAMHI